GADAIGGAVTTSTNRGQGPFSAALSSEAGNYDTLRERFSFGGSYKIFDYAASGSWLESNGQFRNDGSEQRAVAGRFGVTLPANGHVSFSARYNRTATRPPINTTISTSPFFVLAPDSKQHNDTTHRHPQVDQK